MKRLQNLCMLLLVASGCTNGADFDTNDPLVDDGGGKADLAAGPRMFYCHTSDPTSLLAYLGISPVQDFDLSWASAIGFDIDDTLLFSTPAFGRAFATGGTPRPDDTVFWTEANGCDPGCAASTITLADGSTKPLPEN